MNKTDRIWLCSFAITLIVYLLIFISCFTEIPINRPTWHIRLLLYFHIIPMFCLQLLLCRRARVRWRLMIPIILLAVPGFIFLNSIDWDIGGWIFFLIWCVAPLLGCMVAWVVWGVMEYVKKKR